MRKKGNGLKIGDVIVYTPRAEQGIIIGKEDDCGHIIWRISLDDGDGPETCGTQYLLRPDEWEAQRREAALRRENR